MRRLMVSIAAFASLVMPALAQSEAQPVKVTVDMARPDGARGEQIEIFRRVLAGKLQRWQTHAFDAWCMQCHVQTREAATRTFHFLNSVPLNGAGSAGPGSNDALWLDFGQTYLLNVDPHSVPLVRHATFQAPSRPADLEGVYLKGHGVVYTVTLPPAVQTRPAAAAPPPLSDWDRARLELRGEQPKPAEPMKTPEPSLRDTILRVLADNGKRFTGLQDNETITVAVTFRAELLAHPNDAVHQAISSEPRTMAERVHQLETELNKLRAQGFGEQHPQVVQLVEQLKSLKGTKNDKSKDAKAETDARVVAKYFLDVTRTKDDYEVLGDLMVRQNKAQEAIDAYKRALQVNPPADRAAALHRKLAQAYLQKDPEKNAAQAQEALAEAVKLQQGSNEPAMPPSPVAAKIPEKLIITVPMGMLKSVAAGKMTFEEFSKAAHVEHVKW